MRRAIRRNFAWLFWTVIFLAAAQLWVYSHFRYREAMRIGSSTLVYVALTTGQLDFGGEVYFRNQGRGSWWRFEYLDRQRDNLNRFSRFDHDFDFAGFRLGYAKLWGAGAYGGLVGVPFWFLTAVFGMLGVRSIRRRYTREDASSRCRVCGYDLRATPDRCPECGATPEKSIEPIPASAQPS